MNIFKKLLPKKEAILSKEAIINDIPKSVSNVLYPKEVLEIHNEFEIAADKLLEQANNIIEEAKSKDVTKVARLEALGFKQANQVTELKPLLKLAELSKEQVELVNYYKREYPFNKFITEEQVKEICDKYNLVCGDVIRFKGFVPEKNLKEIEKFKLKNKDLCIYGFCWGRGIRSNEAIKKYITFDQYNYLVKNDLFKGDGKGDLTKDDNWCESIVFGFPGKYFDRITLQKLQICAPVQDMDISGLELKEGYKLEKKFIPDPVVLQPVKGGYLILTAWGDEASDPIVINEINN